MNQDTLLVELFTEELPPKALARLGEAFSQGIANGLRSRKFTDDRAIIESFATPRRLAVTVTNVSDRSPDALVREKILPVGIALDASGNPSAPLLKKLAALGLSGVSLGELERTSDGKTETLFYQRTVAGEDLQEGLGNVIIETLARLPIPKMMNYQIHPGTAQERTVQFVRPARRLTTLFGSRLLHCQTLGLTSGRKTLGHRFLSQGEIEISSATQYAQILQTQGKVVPGFVQRRNAIKSALMAAAGNSRVIMPDALLDEVTSLVEWPVVYVAHFEKEFLEVPQECLILTMQQNQKYFALTDATGRMQNRFLLVSNLATEDPSFIIHGNERVLRARLSDAKFFYDQDRKKPLDARLSSLANVVYHNKLGSQLERVARIESLATQIAERLQRDADKARSAAHLAKADLLTDMVGEFPELQGIMGHYYALHDGESEAIAQAIEDHYKPKFSGDSLPRGPLGQIVALADKLETLAGMFAIGNIPTGDKDPFGLRRHALGVLRILGEAHLPLSLPDLVSIALLGFSGASGITDATLLKQQDVLLQFFYDRLRGLLRDEGAKPDEIEAIVSLSPARIDLITNQLEAVRKFAGLPEAPSLAAANKRIGNILKKVEESPVTLDPARLVEPAERILYAALNQLRPEVEKSYANLDYAGGLVALAALRVPVDAFFTEVMVMADDDGIRANRIALLRELHGLMNRIADLSKLVAS